MQRRMRYHGSSRSRQVSGLPQLAAVYAFCTQPPIKRGCYVRRKISWQWSLSTQDCASSYGIRVHLSIRAVPLEHDELHGANEVLARANFGLCDTALSYCTEYKI